MYQVVFHYVFFLFSILWKKLVLYYFYLVVTSTNVFCCRAIDNNFHIIQSFVCDASKPGCPLTTRQPAEYSWMSGNPTTLIKIGQSLLCTGSSTQGIKHVPTITMTIQGPHASKIMAT